jgi:hypothetical protein
MALRWKTESGERREAHASVTAERVMEAAEREMTSLDNPGFCLACGEEAEGCEPDAEHYECEGCGERAVFGAAEIAQMMF